MDQLNKLEPRHLTPSDDSLSCNLRYTIQWCKDQITARVGKDRVAAIWSDRDKIFEQAGTAKRGVLVIAWFFSIRDELGICDSLGQLNLAYISRGKTVPPAVARYLTRLRKRATELREEQEKKFKVLTQKQRKERIEKANKGQGQLL